MCGIAGFSKYKMSTEGLAKMLHAMKHRGPDDEGMYLDEHRQFGLGQVRLSIIDLTLGGHQPMWSKDRRHVIVFNGEVYNFLQIKDELINLGISFHSSSDTEVLLEAYIQWGTACLQRLEGMYAFAIYDFAKEGLFLARDRFGEKPLYYHATAAKQFIFASEIRALLTSGFVSPKLDTHNLHQFLSYQTVHVPGTLLTGVKMLEPAHCLWIDESGIKKENYWKLSFDRVRDTLPDARKNVRDLFMKSVGQRLVSDAPIGAFLSGGIDSTVLVGVASSIVKSFNTYTVAFDDSSFKDGYYAQVAATHFKTNHHEIKLSMDDVLHQVPLALDTIDHPSADGVNTFIVSSAVKKAGIKVALSGLGGDEVFGGYASFRLLSKLKSRAKWLNLVPAKLRHQTAALLNSRGAAIAQKKVSRYLASDLSLAENYLLTRRFFFNDQLRSLGVSDVGCMERVENEVSSEVYSSVSNWEIKYYMHDVLLRDTDQMSMANSLEVRTPFLDSQLVSYVLNLPDDFKYMDGINKSLLVSSLQEFIPEQLKTRPKQGFVMPFDRWMRNELIGYCESRLRYLEETRIFLPGSIINQWQLFVQKSPSINWARIWLLVTFSNWIKVNNISQ
jgi:asparagine synthase (glutamine-hydrolysing)